MERKDIMKDFDISEFKNNLNILEKILENEGKSISMGDVIILIALIKNFENFKDECIKWKTLKTE